MVVCTIIVSEDEPGTSFVSEVRELPGCMSQGDTVPDAVENLADALRAVLEVLEQDGRRPPWVFPKPDDTVSCTAEGVVIRCA